MTQPVHTCDPTLRLNFLEFGGESSQGGPLTGQARAVPQPGPVPLLPKYNKNYVIEKSPRPLCLFKLNLYLTLTMERGIVVLHLRTEERPCPPEAQTHPE